MENDTDKVIRKELFDSGHYSKEVCEMTLSDIRALKEFASEQILIEQHRMMGVVNLKGFLEGAEKFGYVAKEMTEFLYEYSEKYYSKVLSEKYPIANSKV